jgi:hypothetical protein
MWCCRKCVPDHFNVHFNVQAPFMRGIKPVDFVAKSCKFVMRYSFNVKKEKFMSGTMSKEQRLGEIIALRTKMKSMTALRLQVLAAIAEIYKQHGIEIEDSILSDLAIAIPEELKNDLGVVILPGGTNC